MAASVEANLSQFALDVAEGLSSKGQKKIPSRYFYDDLGSTLFDAITLLPEYGLTRADERLLRLHAKEIVLNAGPVSNVAELGSGTGRKTRYILEAARSRQRGLVYTPIDVSREALSACARSLSDIADVEPVCADWIEGLEQFTSSRNGSQPALLLFLGSSIGNVERNAIVGFLERIRLNLQAGDYLLIGADLSQDVDRMIGAYDDPTGVTAAFNRNVLGRMNRELDADFDLRSFAHQVRWNREQRCIEMHLLSCRDQVVHIRALNTRFSFRAGETICTELSHKFTQNELLSYGQSSGFTSINTWIDHEWPFAEALWRVDR